MKAVVGGGGFACNSNGKESSAIGEQGIINTSPTGRAGNLHSICTEMQSENPEHHAPLSGLPLLTLRLKFAGMIQSLQLAALTGTTASPRLTCAVPTELMWGKAKTGDPHPVQGPDGRCVPKLSSKCGSAGGPQRLGSLEVREYGTWGLVGEKRTGS